MIISTMTLSTTIIWKPKETLLKTKLVSCAGCHKDLPAWKNHQGNRYCKTCWMKHLSVNSSGKEKKNSGIRAVSHKQEMLNKEYSKLRKEFFLSSENRKCKARLPGCTGIRFETMTIHHSKGRGKYMLDTSTWVPLCLSCHRWVEDHPREAQEMQLSLLRN
jgi:hypothetical protein